MKLRIVSDLHLEFDRKERNKWEFTDFLDNELLPHHSDDKDTVLVIPGDIDGFKSLSISIEAFSKRFRAVIGVLGNHEYYGGNLPTVYRKVAASIAHIPNAYILDADSIEIDGIHFVGATLWTDMDKLNQIVMVDANQSMTDYKVIRTGPNSTPWQRPLRAVDTTYIHNIHKAYIFNKVNEIKALGQSVVVLSHHLPSYLCIPAEYKENKLNGAYASELFNEIADSMPDLWIHGHTHNNVDVMVADTRVVCNPRGYYGSALNKDFDPNFSVII